MEVPLFVRDATVCSRLNINVQQVADGKHMIPLCGIWITEILPEYYRMSSGLKVPVSFVASALWAESSVSTTATISSSAR